MIMMWSATVLVSLLVVTSLLAPTAINADTPPVAVAAEAGVGVGECQEPLQNFAKCVKAEVSEREAAEHSEADRESGDRQKKFDACWEASGCKGPNWDASPDEGLSDKAKAIWKSMSAWWESTDTDKRHCVIAEIRGGFRTKLEECVAKSIPGFKLEAARDEKKLDPAQKTRLGQLALHRFRIQVAMRQCPKSNDVQRCVGGVRDHDLFNATCQLRQKCANNVPVNCQKLWVEKIRAIVCGCVTKVAENLKKNIIIDASGQPLKDDAIKTKCGVALPDVDVAAVRADPELHTRIKDFVAVHEDRRISMCHDCEGVPF